MVKPRMVVHIMKEMLNFVLWMNEISDVKVSRPTWSRDHFFGLGLGLGLT